MRPAEEDAVRKLLHHGSVALDKVPNYSDPHTKANALLQVGQGGHQCVVQQHVCCYCTV